MSIPEQSKREGDEKEAVSDTLSAQNISEDAAYPSTDSKKDYEDDVSDNEEEEDADEEEEEEEEEPSWFDFGGMAKSLAKTTVGVACGVASVVHQSALSVAAELAEMERMNQNGEELDLPHHRRSSSGGDVNITLHLPWEVKEDSSSANAAQDDAELKRKILLLSSDEQTFAGPFNQEEESDDKDEYLDPYRIALIKRLLRLDPNLAKVYSSPRRKLDETVFWKNYFYHCDRVRSDHMVHDEELDAELVLQTPPMTPSKKDRAVMDKDKFTKSTMSPPKVLSVDDLVLVGFEDENGEDGLSKLAANLQGHED